MKVQDLLKYGEYCLRDDKEYWAQMDVLKRDIDKIINRHNNIMASAIIRLAVEMVSEKNDSMCADCIGRSCEDCLEGKDNLPE